ncbi:MarR family winged helix-turn-helix transcriptional regulator [Marinitenerispora sediminis]|uniref:MarR family transcriptional regulator n=1 Tax=Marinitenerispora sediminis TaxID=1931232 RepID=A0A368T9A3_9ACTN|nr:MarR family transcriptional regulator [Marinitenerispora sediminis]RCV54771.1 MarR family transcriptional regulator [Marinitenerispora sediminis]RCV60553.1 MarR family transcriptional regulator [Marinitenerispora sediminis]RCV61019.1 MarR family transcriptional regulator [Marinitenerispora sediminis]
MDRDGEAAFAEFAAAWSDLVGAVVRAKARGAHNGEHGLTMGQALVMHAISGLERPTVGAVAHALHIASPSATRMLQQLERKGVVARRRCAEDERTILVSVTPHGEELLAEWRARMAERQRQLFDRIAPEQRPVLVALLHDMGAVIDDL